MEAATTEIPQESTAETSPAETDTPKGIYSYSRYVHVGPGAEECEHREDGACEDSSHFHAWCRLPNQFERKSLRDKGLAARARKLRTLEDPESDSRVVMDGELRAIANRGDTAALVEEIVNQEFLRDQLSAMEQVAEDADGDWDLIDEDKERLRALEALPEEERSEEEFTGLRKRISDYTEKVNAAREEIQAPRKDAIEGKSIDELVDIVREQRMENIANQEQNEEYAKWQWYIGTFKPKSPDKPGFPDERMWADINGFTHAAEEEIEAVSVAIGALEAESAASLKGFS
jgi:hypothetical protein